MPLIVVLIFAMQLVVATNALKNGHGWNWVMLIVFVPVLGSFLYIIVIWLPQAKRKAKRNPKRKKADLDWFGVKDSKSDLRDRIKLLDVSDPVSYRVELAELLIENGMPHDALLLYHRSILGPLRTDPQLLSGLAKVYFILEKYENVKNTLDKLIETNPDFKSQEGHLLYARALAKLHDFAQATEEYKVLIKYYSGSEAICRYGLLLKLLKRSDEAREQFQSILVAADNAPEYTFKLNKKWIDIALQEISETVNG